MLKAFGFVVLVLLGSASFGWARCGDKPGDATAAADARAEIETTCSCTGLPTHNAYLACAKGVIAQRIAAGSLSEACGASVKHCAARSTCGSAGAVACCTATRGGKTRCDIRKSAGSCRAPRGGSACVSTQASCCEACANGGCASPTPSPTATPAPTISFVPCNGGSGAPLCDGTCPAGSECSALPDGTFAMCSCVPVGRVTCGSGSGFPTCGGDCLDGRICQPFSVTMGGPPIFGSCTCVDPAVPCGPSVCPAEGPGFCPNHKVCIGFVGGGGVECGCSL